jgi:fucose 4-O-acetylase-like acetyltransferase
MDSRNRLISFMQAFGIILVVAGHSTYQLGHAGHVPSICRWLYTFHMPLFFFISGYLLKYSNTRKGIQLSDMPALGKDGFITGKARRLLVPYVIISSVVFIPKTMMSAIALRPVDMSVWSYLGMLLYPHTNVIGYFWFLPSLFLIFCMAYIAAKTKAKTNDSLLIVCLIAVSIVNPGTGFLGLDSALYNAVFFAAGYMFRKHMLETVVGRHSATAAAVTFTVSVALMYAPDTGIRYLLTSFNGILMSVALAHLYIAGKMRFLDHLDGATYTIYLLSWFPQVASQQILISLVPGITWHVTTALAFFSGLYVPLMVHRWVRKRSGSPSCRWINAALGM